MALNNQYVIFDINNGTNKYLTAKAQDTTGSRAFVFKIINNNLQYDITGFDIKIGGKKPDGKQILIDASILNIKDSLVEFELTTQMMLVQGILNLELIFIKNGIEMSSIPFKIGVIESARDNKNMQSSDEYQTLITLINKVDEWDKYFSDTSGKIEEKYTERLNEHGTQILSNANEIKDIILAVAECIRRDGSIEMLKSLSINGDWNGVKFKNAKGDKAQFIIKQGEVLGIQIHPVDGENIEVIEFGINSIHPTWNRSGQITLGSERSRFTTTYLMGTDVSAGYYSMTENKIEIMASVPNQEGTNKARLNFPFRIGNIINAQLTGRWGNSNNHYWTFGATDESTYVEAYKNGLQSRDDCFFRIVASKYNALNFGMKKDEIIPIEENKIYLHLKGEDVFTYYSSEYAENMPKCTGNENILEINKEIHAEMTTKRNYTQLKVKDGMLDELLLYKNKKNIIDSVNFVDTFFEEIEQTSIVLEPTQQEKDIKFLAETLKSFIEPMTLPGDGQPNPALEKIQEIIDRYS